MNLVELEDLPCDAVAAHHDGVALGEGQVGHAAEAEAETKQMLEIYRDVAENALALPVITGRKPEHEKFPGAVDTYCIEAMMQDGKALQAGTSHFLGQNFAKSAGISFVNSEGKQEFAYTTSWFPPV